MESNAVPDTEKSDVNKSDQESSCAAAENSFDLKDCENALPKTSNGKLECEEDSEDEEFSDADEELDLEEEAIAESHKDLPEAELQVFNPV